MLNGPDIRKLLKDDSFKKALDREKLRGWLAIKGVIEGVLSRDRDEVHFENLVNAMVDAFKILDVHMSLKIHLLHFQLYKFQGQSSTESEEHGERHHQVLLPFESR